LDISFFLFGLNSFDEERNSALFILSTANEPPQQKLKTSTLSRTPLAFIYKAVLFLAVPIRFCAASWIEVKTARKVFLEKQNYPESAGFHQNLSLNSSRNPHEETTPRSRP